MDILEVAGLGRPEYSFVRYEKRTEENPEKCDCCWHETIHVYHILSTDLKRSKICSDCMFKSDNKKLKQRVYQQIEQNKIAALAKASNTIKSKINKLMEENDLDKYPHPNEEMSADGHTLKDFVTWATGRDGYRGACNLYRMIKKTLKEQTPSDIQKKEPYKSEYPLAKREQTYYIYPEHRTVHIEEVWNKWHYAENTTPRWRHGSICILPIDDINRIMNWDTEPPINEKEAINRLKNLEKEIMKEARNRFNIAVRERLRIRKENLANANIDSNPKKIYKRKSWTMR